MLTEKLLNFYLMGAEWVLWLLVILSVVWVSVWVERMIFFYKNHDDIPTFKEKLASGITNLSKEKSNEQKNTFASSVLRVGSSLIAQGVKNVEVLEQAMLAEMLRQRNRYEKRLPILATIGNNAPFIGLFGTVLGIVQAFFQLGKMGSSEQAANNQMVMGAIGEALVATGVGILVAIPAVMAYNWSKTLVATRARDVESLMRDLLAQIARESK